ncbi:interleukin-17A-like [Protopterus annectens]|uniref:interleukin-17A-like n=1 Tax=Protopterus annectens TaxID=7888 RepID=UPI001CF95990|nr:interleukin-17A-like [Protopterus annectens]
MGKQLNSNFSGNVQNGGKTAFIIPRDFYFYPSLSVRVQRTKIAGLLLMLFLSSLVECVNTKKRGKQLCIVLDNSSTTERSSKVPPSGSNAKGRSLSPWNTTINNDPNRYPSSIVEANCLYSGCITTEGQEDKNLISYPIMQEILVIIRIKKHRYRLEKIKVIVGCTCIYPVIIRDLPM